MTKRIFFLPPETEADGGRGVLFLARVAGIFGAGVDSSDLKSIFAGPFAGLIGSRDAGGVVADPAEGEGVTMRGGSLDDLAGSLVIATRFGEAVDVFTGPAEGFADGLAAAGADIFGVGAVVLGLTLAAITGEGEGAGLAGGPFGRGDFVGTNPLGAIFAEGMDAGAFEAGVKDLGAVLAVPEGAPGIDLIGAVDELFAGAAAGVGAPEFFFVPGGGVAVFDGAAIREGGAGGGEEIFVGFLP